MITALCIIVGLVVAAVGAMGFMAEAMADTQGSQRGAAICIAAVVGGIALAGYGVWRIFL